jgi:hypothetical protein
MGGVGTSALSSSTVQASNSNDDFVIEDFEDNDLSEYSVDRGSNYNIVTSPTYEGHYGLELADDAAIELISTSGLGSYPQAGDTFSVRFRTNGTGGGEKANFTYGVQSHTDRYFVQLNPGTQKIQLFKYKGDTSSTMSSAVSVEFAADTWHVLEIQWETDGTHTATLYDEEADTQLAQVTGSDAEWTTGGIGFDAYLSSGEAVYFDDVTFGAAGFLERDGYALIDDFEDGNLSEYSFDRGASGASVVASPTYHGSNALAISGTNTELISTEDLPNYPSIGTSFGCWVRATGGAEKLNFTYGVQDHDNRYYVNLNFNKNRFSLYRWDDSSTVTLDFNDSGFTVSEDAWYKINVYWNRDGSHIATLYDESGHRLVQAQATDTTWESGGVGYDAYLATSGGTVYFDFVTLDLEGVSEVDTIDNFEDGNLAEYEFDRGWSGANVVSNPVYRGSNALEISGTNTEMISMGGLQNYPAAGDVFSYRVRATGGANKTNFTYGVQNHLNRYYVHLKFAEDSLTLLRYEDGSSYVLDKQSSGFTLSEDEWYEVTIDWQEDGTHTVSLSDSAGELVAQVSATDATWPAGGVGFDAYLGSSGGIVYYDHVMLDSGKEVLEHNRVVDDFEDGDFVEYEFDSGTSTGVSIENTPTRSGANVLKISDVNREMVSTSGLETYPSAGDVFSCWVQGTDGLDKVNFTYGVQNHENRYYVHLDFASDFFGVYKYENDTTKTLATDDSLTLTEDRWYNVEVDWRQVGTHIVTLYDSTGARVAQVSASDATWSEGGIGYDAYLGIGGTVYFDYVAIHHAVVDDFEDGNLKEYDGDTGAFNVQGTTVLEGSQTLEGTSAPSTIAHTGVKTPRGYEYEATVMAASGSEAKPGIVGCIQDPSTPLNNCYYVTIDPSNNSLSLYRRDNGTTTLLEESRVLVNEGTKYRLVLQLKPSMVVGILRDTAGNDLEAAGEHDRTHYNGYLGLHVEGGTPNYFDLLTKRPQIGFIDTFKDGNLTEYTGDTSAYTVQSSTVLAGTQTLKAERTNAAIAHRTMQTTRGNGYKCTIKARSDSESRPGLLACVQNPDTPSDDCYWVQASVKYNNLNLFRRDAGSTTVLDTVDVTIEKGKTYQLGIELRDKDLKAKLYSENDIVLAETSIVTDTIYSSGYLGFHTGGSSTPAYYDNLIEVPLTTSGIYVVNASQTSARNALDETLTQEVLTKLNNPSTSSSEVTRENIYLNEKSHRGAVIKIPMEYGELLVVYRKGSVEIVRASLDRSTMSNSLINDLSDSFGWPSSEEGVIINHKYDSDLHFMRSVTNSERSDIKSLVTDHDKRTDEPGRMMVMNRDGGWYRSIYYDKLYDVNDAIDSVVFEDEVIHSPSGCDVSKAGCAVAGTSFAVSTTATAYSCGSMLITAGASAIGCGLSAASAGVSGAGMAVSCYSADTSCPD